MLSLASCMHILWTVRNAKCLGVSRLLIEFDANRAKCFPMPRGIFIYAKKLFVFVCYWAWMRFHTQTAIQLSAQQFTSVVNRERRFREEGARSWRWAWAWTVFLWKYRHIVLYYSILSNGCDGAFLAAWSEMLCTTIQLRSAVEYTEFDSVVGDIELHSRAVYLFNGSMVCMHMYVTL